MSVLAYVIGVLLILMRLNTDDAPLVGLVGRYVGYSAVFGIYFVAWSYYLHESRTLWRHGRYLVRGIAGCLTLSWLWLYGYGKPVAGYEIAAVIAYLLVFVLFGQTVSSQVVEKFVMPPSERKKLGIDRPVTNHVQIINFYLLLMIMFFIPLVMRAVHAY